MPETIEFLELAIIGAHKRGCEFDATLRRALEAAHRRKGAAISHCRNNQFVQHGTVGETVNAIGEVRPYSLGGIVVPFVGIKLIDMAIAAVGLA